MGGKNTNLCLENEREMGQASCLDFSWLLFVGVKMLGFTEKAVGRMTLKKWNLLFEHFKKYHNFKTKGGLFKEEKEVIQDDEWIKG
mgnify:CR=1 FL=1